MEPLFRLKINDTKKTFYIVYNYASDSIVYHDMLDFSFNGNVHKWTPKTKMIDYYVINPFTEQDIFLDEDNTIGYIIFKQQNKPDREIIICKDKKIYLLPDSYPYTRIISTLRNIGVDGCIVDLDKQKIKNQSPKLTHQC